ncbi:MAG: hypothetical protein A3J76_03540 [Candidatus Moranbacteria bacterium RBG_13_45_13]|nr:MAG: hypothetical protein A3J76_03540 [Candidatus Moranbacteria bacterium RBG_13_45_13]
MIDTHAHLDFPEFDEDREEVIRRAFDNGVKAIVNIGVDLERSRKSIEIAKKHEGVFASVGLHPDFFNKVKKEFSIFNFQFSNNSKIKKLLNKLRKLARNQKVVAIGETGLDYFNHMNEPVTGAQKGNQKAGFLAQIEIAKELKLSVIVHCREAWSDLYEIIKNFQFSIFPAAAGPRQGGGNFQTNPNGQILKNKKISNTKFVLHCYSGEKKDTEKFLKLPNIYFSFSGNITYPKPAERAEKLAEAVKMIPLDRIMLDSDAPFLAPQCRRGKRNEPMLIRHIADKIAEIKGISAEEVEKATDKNAEKFFGI